MLITVDDAASKGWWTWALKNGKPDHPEAKDIKKVLQTWEKEIGPDLLLKSVKDKPAKVQEALAPYKLLKDHWLVCLIELVLAERKGIYEAAREAYFRPFKVDDSTRTRRDYRSMKTTTTLYVELLLKRNATSEAKRILDFLERRYSLEPHILAFERGMVFDAMEEEENAYVWLATAFTKNRKAKSFLTDGLMYTKAKDLYPFIRAEKKFKEFMVSPAKFLKKNDWKK
jgi:hypothetical protein